MALRPLNLDDRRFQELVEGALARAKQTCPGWTDFSPSDPGRVMVEVFAHLTDVMLYRLNRLPEKIYVELLRLIGTRLEPPSAAVTMLSFTLKATRDRPVEIPRDTQVAAERAAAGGEPPVFTTAEDARIEAGSDSVKVRAYHCEWVPHESHGPASGFPGLVIHAKRPPIIARTSDGLDLLVGVEARPDELDSNTPVRNSPDGRAFRIWSECAGFSDLGDDRYVYTVDRSGGVITFAPALRKREGRRAERGDPVDAALAADDKLQVGRLSDKMEALAAVPAEGREIMLWYRRGGGTDGNVPKGSLTKLKTPISGVALEVTNPNDATGGRSIETLEHALRRGPEELHSLRRAITASDFETLALRSSGGIGRAHAYTKFDLWKYAPRGTVEVLCIPHVPPERYGDGPLTEAILKDHQNEAALAQVRKALDEVRPVGTNVEAHFGRVKKVTVKGKATVYRQEDPQAVRQRLLRRLYETISPVAGADDKGWGFGQPLDAYDVYRIVTSESGVKSAEIELGVDEVPAANLSALCVDGFQPRTWYASAHDAVFRSLDDGDGWEQIARIEGAEVKLLSAYPREAAGSRSRAGLLAAITQFAEGKSRVYLSHDCGESWQEIGARPEFRIEDMAWTDREGRPALLLATEKGLYVLGAQADADPVPILVDSQRVDLGFHAVVVSTDVWGQTCVAVAALGRGGVYLSTDGGAPGTFKRIGLETEQLGVLAVQHRGAQRFLWAGIEAVGDDAGKGCARWQLPNSPNGWERYAKDWNTAADDTAGGCLALAFLDSIVLAGTRFHGVLTLKLDEADPHWVEAKDPTVLPMMSRRRNHPVQFLASRSPEPVESKGVVMAAGPMGIYRSRDEGVDYELCSRKVFDRVTLPPTWLFCSGVHQIEVSTDEARGD